NIDRPLADALHHVAKTPQTALPRAPDEIEIDFDRNDLLGHIPAINGVAGGIEYAGLAVAARSKPVHVEDIALHHRRSRVADRDIDVAGDRVGHDRMDDEVDTERSELARCFGKPDVVAIENATLACAF